MAGYTPSKAELAQRERELFEWYRSGMSRTRCVRKMQDEWGISSSQAGRWMQKVQKDLRESVNSVDRQDLMAQMTEMLVDAAEMARQQNNPTGVSACVGQLSKLLGLTQ